MSLENDARAEYEKQEFEKLRTVLRAALQNSALDSGIMIATLGFSPAAAIKVNARLMAKWLKIDAPEA